MLLHDIPAIRPTFAQIDLVALLSNFRYVAHCAGSSVWAVVKADGYGHGANRIALALEKETALAGFAVSLLEEGIELRQAGISNPILVMGPVLLDQSGALDALFEYQLTPMLSCTKYLETLGLAAKKHNQQLNIHLKVDTGMNRLGIHATEIPAFLGQLADLPELHLQAVASHLACADTDDPNDRACMTWQQVARFNATVKYCKKMVPHSVQYHLANSAGILRFPTLQYDFARPGLALYGHGVNDAKLSSVLGLHSRITQMRLAPVGASVSYGAHFTTQRDSRLAIIPVGYADGLPRNLSGRGFVLIEKHRCPIVGTISMDMIVVDVTDVPSAGIGIPVVVIGQQGTASISVSEIAIDCGISEYEVCCGISKRVPRRYVEKANGKG